MIKYINTWIRSDKVNMGKPVNCFEIWAILLQFAWKKTNKSKRELSFFFAFLSMHSCTYVYTYEHINDFSHSAFIVFRDWILLVCFSWRYEADRGSTCKFRNARSAFRNLHVDPLSLHTFMRNKQVEFNPYIYTLTTLSKLYRFGYEISVL